MAIEKIEVSLSDTQQALIRKCALASGKTGNQEFAAALINSAIRNKANQMFMSDAAKERLAKRWYNAAAIMGKENMPKSLPEFLSEQLRDVQDMLNELDLA